MADLQFSTHLKWRGTGRDGEGVVTLAEDGVVYSAPASMGGKGVGTSPEELLIAAVASCYSGTLFRLLKKAGLPVEQLEITAEGEVTDYPTQAKFSRLRVSPVIFGADRSRFEEYARVATQARDHCFIGKAIAGNVSYDVGKVDVK
ncbi:OsmC family protein [Alicyclobacillus hesperidum]|uniref:OsmC family protein n=1 Tax=Alicyclobacillus hesperidum TaxID=89784 RepID=UPI00068F745C|nr:OsmC family protein [Alicyclobacillus hesperidum]